MKYILISLSIFLVILFSVCILKNNTKETMHSNESVFSKGQILNSPNFAGKVWLNMMGARDTTLHARFGNVTFAPEARTNWHLHPGGQILLITEGHGYFQEKGQLARFLSKGDAVEILPEVVHWHGASPDDNFSHIAISLNTDEGATEWLKPVTDDEYNDSIKKTKVIH
jgi:quercetin dioxygenase-like cupin family protein